MPGLEVWIHGIEPVNRDSRARYLLFCAESEPACQWLPLWGSCLRKQTERVIALFPRLLYNKTKPRKIQEEGK